MDWLPDSSLLLALLLDDSLALLLDDSLALLLDDSLALLLDDSLALLLDDSLALLLDDSLALLLAEELLLDELLDELLLGGGGLLLGGGGVLGVAGGCGRGGLLALGQPLSNRQVQTTPPSLRSRCWIVLFNVKCLDKFFRLCGLPCLKTWSELGFTQLAHQAVGLAVDGFIFIQALQVNHAPARAHIEF